MLRIKGALSLLCRALLALSLLAGSPAWGALALNTSAHFPNMGGTTTATISTTAPTVLVIFVETNNANITGISDPTLGAWTKRKSNNTPGTGAGFTEEEWYVLAPSNLTSEVITITTGSGAFTTGDVIAVSGANMSSPFDVNASLPFGIVNAGDLAVVSTTALNTMVIGGYRVGTSNPTQGAGFTLPSGSGADFHLTEYVIETSAQTNLTLTIGTGNGGQNGGIGDAIVQSGGTPPPTNKLFLSGPIP